MGTRIVQLWRRRLGVTLIMGGVVAPTAWAPAASGQTGGVVFVGDLNPAQATQSSGPQLPALASPAIKVSPRSIDARYLDAPTSTPSSTPRTIVSRADYAQAINQQIQEAQAPKKKSLFSRLMPSFGRKQETPAASPAPALPPAFNGGVQQAAYAERYQMQNESGGRGGILSGPGVRQRTGGLFSRGQSKRQPTTPAKPKAIASKPKRQPSMSSQRPQAIAKKSTVKGPLNALAAKSTPAEPKPLASPRKTPSSGGVVFVGDQPKATPTNQPVANQPVAKSPAKLPRPRLLPSQLGKEGEGASPQPLKPAPTPMLVTIPGAMPLPEVAAEEATSESALSAPTETTLPLATAPTPKPIPQPVANPVPASAANETPSPRAVALLMEANRLSQTATTEQELSHLVRRCRHVLAIDGTRDVVAYARKLAGWSLNKRGELRADDGREHEAMTDFEDALAMDPRRWRAAHNRGVLLAQSGMFAEAFDAFNDTIDQNPDFAKAYSNRASLYVQAGDFEAALADYSRAITKNPDLAIAHKGKGRVCHMLGQLEQALRHLDAAVFLSPQDASVVNCLADLLVDMGRYAAARDAYQRAIELDANLASAYRNLAWLQATCPDARYRSTDLAVANAKRAMEIAGVEDDISLDTLAAALAAAGDFPAAVTTIRRAIELAPAGDQPVYSERLSLYESGRPFLSSPATDVTQAGYEAVRR